ncbi:hypothetical protein SAMN05661010_00342 [Modicisalibacter muralis]|uniref:Toxin CptA n=1 Tax=Modicisalibacter muralis TaxID=119000 RepID=A0A1G9FDG5_9GAMM|nr:hypothetical protein [Halomonas muralis]SDK86431.1 hypothetical protein SAMN05661010_00342 [Halomonas muralis]
MLKQPVTISIAPSRLALTVTALLGLATCLVVARYGPPWLTVTAVLALCAAVWRECRRVGLWRLRWVPGIEGGWQQQPGRSGEWRPVELCCDYLGPWLIGLRIAGRRHWLWPDSASFDERRALRRVLLWNKSTSQR